MNAAPQFVRVCDRKGESHESHVMYMFARQETLLCRAACTTVDSCIDSTWAAVTDLL